MADLQAAAALQTQRQIAHWVLAASRLVLDDLAGEAAWGRLEQYLGLALRRHLQAKVDALAADAQVLMAHAQAARSPAAQAQVRRLLLAFRRQYLRTETTLDFFADAINTRTNPQVAAMLRACDSLAYRSMSQVLDELGHATPVVLTYLDSGAGAAIMKAGLRLWDGGAVCPVATIKITRHNLLRPTAVIHEAGHQAAHITGWNDELRTLLQHGLVQVGSHGDLADVWASWASEIAADAFAFGHTGFASVAALHDVLSGEPSLVFRFSAGDPHPVSYLRVQLGAALCRHCYGAGPWDELELAWTGLHPLERVDSGTRALITDSQPLLPELARLLMETPMRCFRGRSLRELLHPQRVSPAALDELQSTLGPALFTSAHWLWTEPLRTLGLTGLQLARCSGQLQEAKRILEQQQQSMLRMGGALQSV